MKGMKSSSSWQLADTAGDDVTKCRCANLCKWRWRWAVMMNWRMTVEDRRRAEDGRRRMTSRRTTKTDDRDGWRTTGGGRWRQTTGRRRTTEDGRQRNRRRTKDDGRNVQRWNNNCPVSLSLSISLSDWLATTDRLTNQLTNWRATPPLTIWPRSALGQSLYTLVQARPSAGDGGGRGVGGPTSGGGCRWCDLGHRCSTLTSLPA